MSPDRRTFLKVAGAGALGAAALGYEFDLHRRVRGAYLNLTRARVGTPIADPPGTEVLYNGIQLATPWPPYRQQLDRRPQFAPYLEQPPALIPIDVGRQLFVDDFLIEDSELD